MDLLRLSFIIFLSGLCVILIKPISSQGLSQDGGSGSGDNEDDCVDGSYFCSNSTKCILELLLCDGVNHCGDWEDESVSVCGATQDDDDDDDDDITGAVTGGVAGGVCGAILLILLTILLWLCCIRRRGDKNSKASSVPVATANIPGPVCDVVQYPAVSDKVKMEPNPAYQALRSDQVKMEPNPAYQGLSPHCGRANVSKQKPAGNVIYY